MTLTDKLERMGKLVTVMAEDEEARAAYMTLRREIEPDVAPLLDLIRKAGIVTPTAWDHVAIIEDINDVVLELLPESQMSVEHLSQDGFILEWQHGCGASVCSLCYGDSRCCLGVKVPCSKAMTHALSSIAGEYDLELYEYCDDEDKDEEEEDDEEES
jgi:hypothetical protein